MSPGHPCVHCTARGCAIYPTRPRDPCRTFECAWLSEGSQLPEALRPDRCGAIVMLGRQYQGRNVIMATPTGWIIPQDTLQQLMAYAKEQSLPLVWVENIHENGVYQRFKRSAYGPIDFVRAITDPSETLDISRL